MTEMPKPEWSDDSFNQIFEKDTGKGGAAFKIPDFVPVTCFSTFFAEYMVKEGDLLVHLFPRAGGKDEWSESRREVDTGARFPSGIEDKIRGAADEVWQGDVAIVEGKIWKYPRANPDIVEDETVEVSIGTYAIQFQNAGTAVKTLGIDKFMDKFCEELDARLEVQ